MAMQTDVKAQHLEVTGTIYPSRARLKGYQCLTLAAGAGGDITFRDGGPSGTVRLEFNVPSGAIPFYVLVPGEGILFNQSIHVTLPEDTGITAFYG